jgi:hypothetical protein
MMQQSSLFKIPKYNFFLKTKQVRDSGGGNKIETFLNFTHCDVTPRVWENKPKEKQEREKAHIIANQIRL